MTGMIDLSSGLARILLRTEQPKYIISSRIPVNRLLLPEN